MTKGTTRRPVKAAGRSVDAAAQAIRQLIADFRAQGYVENEINAGPFKLTVRTKLPHNAKS